MTKKILKTNKKDVKKTDKEQEVEELKGELGNAIDLKVLHDSAGGKLLIEGLISDVFGAIDLLCMKVGEMSHIELVSMVIKMKERIDLLKTMTGAKARKEVYEDLLKDALGEEEENTPEDPHPTHG